MAQSTEVLKIKFFVNLHKISQIKEVCTWSIYLFPFSILSNASSVLPRRSEASHKKYVETSGLWDKNQILDLLNTQMRSNRSKHDVC
jgi:hypothetical protein